MRFLLASASEGSHSWPRPPCYQNDNIYRDKDDNLLGEEKTLVAVGGVGGDTVRVPAGHCYGGDDDDGDTVDGDDDEEEEDEIYDIDRVGEDTVRVPDHN